MTDGPAGELAESLASRLSRVRGVVAVSLGGSVARGSQDAASDVDIGLYYARDAPLDVLGLRTLANEVDDRGSVELTDLGGWGPRINGGGWLVIGGRRVDWLYREIDAVRDAIAECRAGRSVPIHQPGHPWGWQAQIYAGEVVYGVSLADAHDELGRLRGAALPYPEALRDAKLRTLWEAGFTLDVAETSAARGSVVHVVACLSSVAATIADAIFAAGGLYRVNEKQAGEIGRSVHAPAGAWEALSAVLAAPGRTPAELVASVRAARAAGDAVSAWATVPPSHP